MNNKLLRLAVWSGPRNISTALMRSWGNRPDTHVIDEPFYAHYLYKTGVLHPGREEVLASQSVEWTTVRDNLLAPLSADYLIYYQKHMAHHYLPDMQGDWINQLTNVFLLRDPGAMLTSLDKVTPSPCLNDTGLPQQLALFQQVKDATGKIPLVIDSADILRQPERALQLWCQHLGIAFKPSMLRWPSGSRDTDGVWARYWYDSVRNSTEFQAPATKGPPLPGHLQNTLSHCLSYYQELHAHRLVITD